MAIIRRQKIGRKARLPRERGPGEPDRPVRFVIEAGSPRPDKYASKVRAQEVDTRQIQAALLATRTRLERRQLDESKARELAWRWRAAAVGILDPDDSVELPKGLSDTFKKAHEQIQVFRRRAEQVDLSGLSRRGRAGLRDMLNQMSALADEFVPYTAGRRGRPISPIKDLELHCAVTWEMVTGKKAGKAPANPFQRALTAFFALLAVDE